MFEGDFIDEQMIFLHIYEINNLWMVLQDVKNATTFHNGNKLFYFANIICLDKLMTIIVFNVKVFDNQNNLSYGSCFLFN